jgi:hypothetical protein
MRGYLIKERLEEKKLIGYFSGKLEEDEKIFNKGKDWRRRS